MSEIGSPPPPAAAGFTVKQSLMLWFGVFKRRPVSVVRLAALQIVIFALAGVGQLWLLGALGEGVIAAGSDPAALARSSAFISLASLVTSVVFVVLWAGVETAWLELFLRDTAPFRAGPGPALRILASLLIIYMILMAAVFVLSIVGAVLAVPVLLALGSDPEPVMIFTVMTLAILAPMALFALLVMTRFTALPALTAMGEGLPIGRAWRGAGPRLGRVIGAWMVWLVVYLAAMAITGLLLALGPGPYAEALGAAFESLDDPAAQYRVYAEFARSPAEIAAFSGVLAVTNAVFVVVLAFARGIGVSLALDIQARGARP